MRLLQIPVRADNYVYLLHDPVSCETAVVDPTEALPVLEVLNQTGWRLSHILITHHHPDHVGGNLDLKAATGARVIGAEADVHRIPGIDQTVVEGDRLTLGDNPITILETPGHTLGHICYWMPESLRLFCGDTLFSLGCGRLFEGTPGQMWGSLDRLRHLPGDTMVYCAHEYTLANGRFALHVEPENQALRERVNEAERLRAEGKATVPTLMRVECATNPFLRVKGEGAFTEMRRNKDVF